MKKLKVVAHVTVWRSEEVILKRNFPIGEIFPFRDDDVIMFGMEGQKLEICEYRDGLYRSQNSPVTPVFEVVSEHDQ